MEALKNITEEMKKKLREPLPPEAISQHPTKTFLSTIKAIYVVERLNEVFGIGKWSLKSEIVDNKTSMIVVKSRLIIPEYGIELESYGGNNNGGENSKNFDLGDAYKGAVTDALTKMTSYLEIGIDVFKGLVTPSGNQSTSSHLNAKEDNRPWLKENQLSKIIHRIKNGEAHLKESAVKEFKMKKEYKQQIMEA
jgi:hypothetical protein